jgi:hypothetical protein
MRTIAMIGSCSSNNSSLGVVMAAGAELLTLAVAVLVAVLARL